jgi:hypothetical protein
MGIPGDEKSAAEVLAAFADRVDAGLGAIDVLHILPRMGPASCLLTPAGPCTLQPLQMSGPVMLRKRRSAHAKGRASNPSAKASSLRFPSSPTAEGLGLRSPPSLGTADSVPSVLFRCESKTQSWVDSTSSLVDPAG